MHIFGCENLTTYFRHRAKIGKDLMQRKCQEEKLSHKNRTFSEQNYPCNSSPDPSLVAASSRKVQQDKDQTDLETEVVNGTL